MAPRPSWKGYLKLSLVSCPVALYPASSTSERLALHMLNGETGHRLKQQYVDSETGEIVERDARVKGYEVAKDDYVVVTDEELAAVKIESSHTIEIETFVPVSEVDRLYFDNNYYLAPDDKVGEEAFAVIREAMRRRDMAGVARVVLFGRERMLLLEPRSKGLLGTTLRYGKEVRAAGAYFDDLPDVGLSKELLDLASHIIDTKAGAFQPDAFKDRYGDAVTELVHAKQKGRPVPAGAESPRPSNVVDLMDALRRSLGQQGSAATPRAGANTAKKAPTRKSAAKPATASAAKSPAKSVAKSKTKSAAEPAKATRAPRRKAG